ncbi:hypothetical protein HJFPF1_08110 [Paramyrothecium foliicola]|nr:hypothetical protein HJFPF1_08110 [Paramyrothecium foliicola]
MTLGSINQVIENSWICCVRGFIGLAKNPEAMITSAWAGLGPKEESIEKKNTQATVGLHRRPVFRHPIEGHRSFPPEDSGRQTVSRGTTKNQPECATLGATRRTVTSHRPLRRDIGGQAAVDFGLHLVRLIAHTSKHNLRVDRDEIEDYTDEALI